MADIMVDSVTTGIDLNETKAVEAINRLKSAVKDSTREWQINEAQAKSAGDAVSASKYRYEGLSEAMGPNIFFKSSNEAILLSSLALNTSIKS